MFPLKYIRVDEFEFVVAHREDLDCVAGWKHVRVERSYSVVRESQLTQLTQARNHSGWQRTVDHLYEMTCNKADL
jgi:hypothetical protein